MIKYNEKELDFILKLQPGMMYLMSVVNENNEGETIFYIKEEEQYINRLGNAPKLTIRSKIFISDYIYNYYFMVNVNNERDMLYDNWINFHEPLYSKEIFKNLLKQEKLRFRFINRNGFVRREVFVKNTLKETLLEYKKLSEKGPWMMEDFNFVKSYIYKKYPTGKGLWHSMNKGDILENVSKEELKTVGKHSSIRAKEIHYFTF